MTDKFIIKYWYNNDNLDKAASDHVFRYLSALGDCKFVEDRDQPVIWRDDENSARSSVKAILSRVSESKDSPDVPGERIKNVIYISPDPIETISEKISINTVYGPYSEIKIRPENSLRESLGRIVKEFFKQLAANDIIPSNAIDISLWPSGHNFAVAVTHDVDIPYRSVRGSFKLLFKRDVPGGLKGLFDSIRSAIGLARNPYDRIGEWVGYENEKKIKSTFFVFAGRRKSKNDPKYAINKLKRSIDLMAKSGYELGLHSGIECYNGDGLKESSELIQAKTGMTVTGIRPHYLSASLPGYWRSAAENGFEYSSCLGFDEDIGFYRGIDLPFVPFDGDNQTVLDIVEIPIAIMDCGLISEDADGHEESLDAGKKLLDRVKSAGGILVLDWHQRTLYNADYPGWAEVFFGLIDYARDKGAYFTTLGEAARLLKSRMADES
jgi:hypothetical protein